MSILSDISNPGELAEVIGVRADRLLYHTRILRSGGAYTHHTIPKRSGGVREIHAPAPGLRAVQRRLNKLLQEAYDPKPSAHGFLTSRSIVSNAKPHTRKHWVLNLDLKDFFPSIHFGRVRGMLMGIPYHASDDVATFIAQLTTLRNEAGEHSFLPQGAPTSPIITNMICARMDAQLQRLAKEARATYTRYADDITFSTTLSHFPELIAETSPEAVKLSQGLLAIIRENGFEVNPDKTRLQHYSQRQEVTGVIVNDGVNVSRKFIRNTRAMLHKWRMKGEDSCQREMAQMYPKTIKSFRRVVEGRILFIQQIRGKENYLVEKLWTQFRSLENSRS